MMITGVKSLTRFDLVAIRDCIERPDTFERLPDGPIYSLRVWLDTTRRHVMRRNEQNTAWDFVCTFDDVLQELQLGGE